MRLFGTFLKRVVGAIALEVSAYGYVRQMIREQEQGASEYFRECYEGDQMDAKTIWCLSRDPEKPQAPATH